jgi:murein DD-endopeptidase MepM/ murein hydrolase activator NlpD
VTVPPASPTPGSPTAAPTVAVAAITPVIQAPAAAGIGEAFSLHVFAPGASTVDVELDGVVRTAAPAGERFWLIVGVPVDAAPGPRTLRAVARTETGAIFGTGVAPLRFVPVERPVDYLDLTDEQSSVLTDEAARTELAMRAAQFSQFDSVKRWTGRFFQPLFGLQTTAFGQGRSINGGPVGGFHSGMDIAADFGDPVRASAPGRVSWVGEMPIRGRSIIIDHGAGVKSGYHHLNGAFVTVGTTVATGDVIGAAGSTGLSTGPHLHWEVTVWGVNVDPLQWTRDSFEP